MEGSSFSAAVVCSALDALEEQIAILDRNGVITQVNEAWRQWVVAGASPGAAVEGGRYQQLLGAAAAAGDVDAAELKTGLEGVLAGTAARFEREYARKRGDAVRWFSSRVTRLRTNAGAVVVAHYEITARKRAEQEREAHRVELGRAVRAATLGQLGGALAHELNQPLTAILANAQAARAALGAARFEDQSQILSDIVEDARRAGQVIHRLRSLLQKHAAKLEVVDVNHITEDVLVLSRSALLLRKVRLMPALWDGPLLVRADAIELQHLLLNLIVNACEAMASTDPRKRVLRVVTSLEESGQVRVAISDSGPGIEPSSRDRIFEPFYTTKKHGLGLGLSICRSIAAVHHGQLVVADSATGGAEVSLTLPAAHPAARATEPPGFAPDGGRGTGPRVPPANPTVSMRHPWGGA